MNVDEHGWPFAPVVVQYCPPPRLGHCSVPQSFPAAHVTSHWHELWQLT